MWPLPMPGVPLGQEEEEGSTRAPSKASSHLLSICTSHGSSHRSGSSRADSKASAREDVELTPGLVYEMSRGLRDWFPGGPASTRVAIVRSLGRGSFGSVYQTEEAGKERRSALKVFGKREMQTQTAAALFSRELGFLMLLDHPGVARVLDVLHTSQHVALLMEYAGRQSLFQAQNRSPQKRFSPVHAQPLFAQIASAIAHCHQHGVVHRDLKPENVVLSDDGLSAKVVDFGSAAELAVALEPAGTVPFVAPEVMSMQAHRFSAAKADVWSLGVLLLEMLCGLNCLPEKLQWDVPCLPSPALAADLVGLLADERSLGQMLEQEMRPSPFGKQIEDLIRHMVSLSVSRRWTASEVVDSTWVHCAQGAQR